MCLPRGVFHSQRALTPVRIPHTSTICNIRTHMPFWKPKSKLAGRVFAILRSAPTFDEETTYLKPSSGPAHDRSDLPFPSRPPLTPITLTSTHADLATPRLDISLRPTDGISWSDDPTNQADHQERYGTGLFASLTDNHSCVTVQHFSRTPEISL